MNHICGLEGAHFASSSKKTKAMHEIITMIFDKWMQSESMEETNTNAIVLQTIY